MFQSSRTQFDGGTDGGAEVNMTPLIDMVFILLIFFLVTARFTPDEGVKIERPLAASATRLPTESLRVVIAATGELYMDGRLSSETQLRVRVREFKTGNGDGTVTVAPDRHTFSGRLVEVMDIIKLEGINNVAVVTRPPGK